MKNLILLSIITIGIDESEILESLQPIKSILGIPDIESIIVTPNYDLDFQQSLPFSRFIQDPGLGVYPAMNTGLRCANGSYVWFLNAGDKCLLDHNSILSLLEILRKNLHLSDSKKLLPIIIFNSRIFRTSYANCLSSFLLKCSLFSLGMPISHQNILIPLSIHKLFSLDYSYCSDYHLFVDLVFNSGSLTTFSNLNLSCLRPGGISDINRLHVFYERFCVMSSLFPKPYSLVFFVFCGTRIFRELVARFLKKIFSYLAFVSSQVSYFLFYSRS